MSRRILLLLLCIGGIAHAETIDRVVAVVNGEPITQTDLDRAMATQLPQIVSSADRDATFHSVRRQALERLIDDQLLRHAMNRSKVTVEPDEVDTAMEGFLKDRKLTQAQLTTALKQQGIPLAQFRQRMEEELKQMKFVQQELARRVKITDQELHDYYEQHAGQFRASGRVRVAQIVLPVASGMSAPEREAVRARAAALVHEARQGDFAALAQAHSSGPGAAAGGELGVVDPTTLHPQIRRALMGLRVGEVSDPIPSKVGYHILKLLDRGTTSDADFERLRDQIQQVLYQRKMAAAVAQYARQLRQRAYIEVKQ